MKVRWAIGAIIHHKKYAYRGVIVSFDPCCRADEQWYSGNRTQPHRDQPWYHVLVDNSETTTYVAEENLELAMSKDPIEHPLLTRFFSSYFQGHYYSHTLN
ncbi:MAG: heat shock protein HspQ [Gemmatimonadetes bacterium]|jgi:heat shock protein HspQ|nr:heat shock protein HspQ [Gemmatimonadota bacterium]MDE0965912.1 heat shock protein HspQ [Candidatus Latescibacterota bacterium]MBT5325664.1 heat shock protein HspQ [Gemmatimonadota bacterium]MBT5449725.1 heat shock protein HspQ [Gemmatimonadota bacterium]MBT5802753.1 heat shock protein HspQ [Gemmatimonadota bacterium]|tara:strand:+ start:130 stop:432 length:303 start_codon:yes stop_codon:yes gene_type:complete